MWSIGWVWAIHPIAAISNSSIWYTLFVLLQPLRGRAGLIITLILCFFPIFFEKLKYFPQQLYYFQYNSGL